MERGPTCDFCDIECEDEDDELVELRVGGSSSEPRTIHLREVYDNRTTDSRMGGYNAHGAGKFRFLGYSGDAIAALIRFMEQRDEISLNISDGINEMQRTGGRRGHFESKYNPDKSCVDLSIVDATDEDPPDAEVCEDCAEMFRSL